jgi:carbon storage regulator
MLVLARRVNERLLIPAIGTAVQVVAIKHGHVRLGIEAPPHITVFREEVYQQRQRENGRLPEATAAAHHPEVLRRERVLRNHLHTLSQGLAALHRQAPTNLTAQLQATLDQLKAEWRELVRDLGGPSEEGPFRGAAPQRAAVRP